MITDFNKFINESRIGDLIIDMAELIAKKVVDELPLPEGKIKDRLEAILEDELANDPSKKDLPIEIKEDIIELALEYVLE